MPHYWAFRVDVTQLSFLQQELYAGRLRQGWGYHEGQDLRDMTYDGGAKANLRMLEVRKDDVILVPHLPTYGEVAIVRATEDWATGYRYQVDAERRDYGHIFPVEFISCFVRNNEHVRASIRTTLRTPKRFWNLDTYGEDIQLLLNQEASLTRNQSHVDRLQSAVDATFAQEFNPVAFGRAVHQNLMLQFGDASWENVLVHGIQQLFPAFVVEHTGGHNEQLHGTDILIRIPGLISSYSYGIAIQVKDYEGAVSTDILQQINKATYWGEQEPGLRIIDRVVVLLRADAPLNEQLVTEAGEVRILFASDAEELLTAIALKLVNLEPESLYG